MEDHVDKYPREHEGIVDIKKLLAERDELEKLMHRILDLNTKNDTIVEQFQHLLKIIGDEGKCRGCGVPIWWIVNPKTGKKLPITHEGLNHFADCPVANKFRKDGKE
jgi:hypothetical protein